MAKVLLVDDEPWIDSCASYLRRREHVVDVARDGRQGLELLANGPDIVFLDCRMPVMDGYGFLVQKAHGEYKDVPVVGVGAFERDTAGLVAQLYKPFHLEAIVACIGQYAQTHK